MSHKKISYFATVIFISVFVVLVPSFVFWQQLVHVFASAWQQLVPAFALAWQQLVPVFAFAWQQRVPVFALYWPVFAFAGPSSSTSLVFCPHGCGSFPSHCLSLLSQSLLPLTGSLGLCHRHRFHCSSNLKEERKKNKIYF